MKKVFTPKKKQSFSRGFTLIELLVVIGIIGILAGLVFTTINSVRANARDAKRIFELTQFKNILEFYNFDNDSYPLSTPGYEIPDAPWGELWPGYTPIAPEDPLSTQTYAYISDGTNYQIYAKLERMSDPTFSCGGCGPDDCSYNAFFASPGVSVDDFAGYRTVYIDEDGDGFGAGVPDDVCNIGAVPPGWALNGTDCDDDPITGGSVWDLNTCSADADGDGVCISSSVQLCTDGSCPAGYCSSPGTDCDDDPITGGSVWETKTCYEDADGDGVCRSSGAQLCTDGSCPAGYCSSPGTDCNDNNGSISSPRTCYTDTDGDGVCGSSSASLCVSSCPGGYCSSPGSDCAPGDGSKWVMRTCYSDTDGDGVCSTSSTQICSGASCPGGYCSSAGSDCAPGNGSRWRYSTCYSDGDGDGACEAGGSQRCIGTSCEAAGYCSTVTDACPGIPIVNPIAYYSDSDGDGYCGSSATWLCESSPPAGYCSSPGSDCNDGNGAVHPGAGWGTGSVDYNCSGSIEKARTCYGCSGGRCTVVNVACGAMCRTSAYCYEVYSDGKWQCSLSASPLTQLCR